MDVINYNVMKNKHSYSAPEAEILKVKFEKNFMDSFNTDGSDFSDHGNVKPQGEDVWHWYDNN